MILIRFSLGGYLFSSISQHSFNLCHTFDVSCSNLFPHTVMSCSLVILSIWEALSHAQAVPVVSTNSWLMLLLDPCFCRWEVSNLKHYWMSWYWFDYSEISRFFFSTIIYAKWKHWMCYLGKPEGLGTVINFLLVTQDIMASKPRILMPY